MGAVKNLFADAHGLLAVILIVAVTILTAIGVMPIDHWESYTKWIFGLFAGSHAVITAADSLSSKSSTDTTKPNGDAK